LYSTDVIDPLFLFLFFLNSFSKFVQASSFPHRNPFMECLEVPKIFEIFFLLNMNFFYVFGLF
jgi:hypothetical protein